YLWADTLPETPVHGEAGLAALLRANFIMCPTVCYHLPVLQNRRFDPAWHVMLDLDLYGRLLLDGETLTGIRQTLYACRRHPQAATTLHEKNFVMFEEGTRCIQRLADKAAALGWRRAAETGTRKRIYHLYVALRVLRNLRPGNIKASCQFTRRYLNANR
ncbi:MAG: hypothetical protein K2Q01_11855, partial [Rickettsiales bacterium]|nr:hypothetical protein [Rickettsiales bacterium]